MSKYVVISGPYFPVSELNTGKYGPEITTYLENFQAVLRNVITLLQYRDITTLFFCIQSMANFVC